MSILVADTAGLIAALASADAGETILLAPGAYAPLNTTAVTAGVTITSADVTNPAVLTGMYLTNSANIAFKNVDFSEKPTDLYYPNWVENSQNISFTNVHFHGTPSAPLGPEQSGLYISNSTNVTVENSEFEHLGRGLVMGGSSGVTVTGNYFHDLRSDGIDAASTSNLKISSNYITDFHPAKDDHPDGIQIFTGGTKVAAHDITIQNNLITRGIGDAAQGIFIQDETGHLQYTNVTVTGNTVIGALYNGISVTQATHVQITDNRVGSLPDQLSWIRADGDSGVVVSGNVATQFVGANASSLGNTVIATLVDKGEALLHGWLGDPSSHLDILPSVAQLLPGLAAVAPSAVLVMTPFDLHADLTSSSMNTLGDMAGGWFVDL